MDVNTLLVTIALSFLPISELRGAIPFAVARGAPLLEAAAIAVACNALVGPVALDRALQLALDLAPHPAGL
ncbi:MAG TPA: hypothetical protein PLW80_07690, partial [Spirochaetales bacterium]|nr:hypothetical protein [Spirochaetales bacterium]